MRAAKSRGEWEGAALPRVGLDNIPRDNIPPATQATSEGRPFVPENFQLNRAFHLHFNRLDQKFWLNGKRTCRVTSHLDA